MALNSSSNQPWHRRFQSLMPFRIREILLISSRYDAFVLEEDGSLTDRLFVEYSELNLTSVPRVTHTESLEEAAVLLTERRFDLVVTVIHIGLTNAAQIAERVKSVHPDLPVALLIFDEDDLRLLPEGIDPSLIDRVFHWTGSATAVIAMIKLIEDQRNVWPDVKRAGVQVILVVEDSVRSYSRFLSLLYPELLSQADTLIGEGLNNAHRLTRMRARPKIVLATDFDQALELFSRLSDTVSALMSDIRMPRGGKIHPEGGLELAQLIRARNAHIALLFQSAEVGAASQKARDLGAWFVNKNAPTFQRHVRNFLKEALGFGDFIFRLPDRTEVGRAQDTYEMKQALRTVPGESLEYHASHNHFSLWLMARTMFDLANRIRPVTPKEFSTTEELREHLISVLDQAHEEEQEGVITDLTRRNIGPLNRFVRVGRGSIGGKGRSVAFLGTQIARYGLLRHFDGLEIRIPKTVVIGTDVFDGYMAELDLSEILVLDSDVTVTQRMLNASLPEERMPDLWTSFDALKGPLAVRSSSLLEDSRFQPFAGVYATYMLPNNHPDTNVRFRELLRAIKAVYASAYWQDARNYFAGTPHDVEDQKMAVVVQQVVGQRFGSRFYPQLSGVAQSYNYYPVGGQDPHDGVAYVALGLGQMVVMGGTALRFSPGAPNILPQFRTASDFVNGSQNSFYAVDLTRPRVDLLAGTEASLSTHDLRVAERDGMLALVGSVYNPQDDVIRESLTQAGPRVVTFNNILKWNALPLAAALKQVLHLLRDGMGEDVEMEFALDVSYNEHRERRAILYLLQLRPMCAPEQRSIEIDLDDLPRSEWLCRTPLSLGNGMLTNIRDVVFAEHDHLDGAIGRVLADRIQRLNHQLREERRPYILIGPGRWGSADPNLGIPVTWLDISGARIVVETPIGELSVEPSQGTHFFRNITSRHVGYLSVGLGNRYFLDRQWLRSQPALTEHAEPRLRHIRLEEPLGVLLNGRQRAAVVLKSAGAISANLSSS